MHTKRNYSLKLLYGISILYTLRLSSVDDGSDLLGGGGPP
jgi:hypothetical protein